MSKLIYIILLILLPYLGSGQALLRFQSKLANLGVELLLPTEGRYKVFAGESSSFFQYDLKLKSRKDKVEVFLMVNDLASSEMKISFPHIHFMRTIAHLASNNEDDTIVTNDPGFQHNHESYNWYREVDFIPKRELTGYHKALGKSYYKSDEYLLTIVFFYNEGSALPKLLKFD